MAVKNARPKWRQVAVRVGIVAGACALLWFAVEGGEYGTRAVFAQHARRQALELEVAQLKQDVDSLQKEKTTILKSDVVLERIAREQYGMLKGNKEILFWMNSARVEKDTSVIAGDTLSAH